MLSSFPYIALHSPTARRHCPLVATTDSYIHVKRCLGALKRTSTVPYFLSYTVTVVETHIMTNSCR